MNIKRILIFSLIIFLSGSIIFAYAHTSLNYSLRNPKIVISGDKAYSINYSLDGVEIGNISAGKAESVNFSLEASPIGQSIIPNPHILNPATSPTSVPTQTLSGTKDIATSIYINGQEAVPLNNETTWSYDVPLTEGDNTFIITSRNIYGQESNQVTVTITLTTATFEIVITSPADGSTIYAEP